MLMMRRLFFLFALTSMPALAASDIDDASARLFQAQVERAETGESTAQYYLGAMYEEGLGTKADINKALEWYRKSASQGNALAKKRLVDLERGKTEAEKRSIAVEKARAAQADNAKSESKPQPKPQPVMSKTDKQADDIEARRRAAKDAYEKARAQQKKATGLWQ